MQIVFLLGLLTGVAADCYLQSPPGGNNRLDEGGGNRNNNNRLMDTQNNAKGGYGYGGDQNNPAQPLKYMANSILTTSWTSQHSCGSMNAECQIVVQYMCNAQAQAGAGLPTANTGDGEGPIRDGVNNNTPDPNNPDEDTGLHEPASFYQDCEDRERNKGLYTADQNMNNNNGATATRQNPNGNRSGQECPEERDYYPYWHPSPWKDVAILTNNLALCDWYQAESQNVKGKNYCSNAQYNNQADCNGAGATWQTQAPFNIPAPECVAAPFQRDNHLGNAANGQEVMYNWTIPKGAGPGTNNDDATNCVMRFRYNITTADTQVCGDAVSGLDKSLTTKAACEAAGKTWSAAYLDSSYNNAVQGNNNNANGNSAPALLEGNPDTDLGGFLNNGGGTDSLLELAVNTNQYGRTFQDRTHVFSIQSRPAAVGDTTPIYNLNVKGKRGNIVQTYPATEYDFQPNILEVGANDMVHVQWTGNDNTNNNGGNNGEGTNDEDRHNIVQLSGAGVNVGMAANQQNMFDVEWEWNPDTTADFGGARSEAELTKQFALVKQTGCATNPNNDQARNNCQKLNSAAATVDLGLIKFKPGSYEYASTRNNNFSNRAQKAHLSVSTSPTVPPGKPVQVQAFKQDSGNSERASVMVTWAKPGSTVPATGFDGKEYWNKEQQIADVMEYTVEYSLEGGAPGTWVSAGSQCQGNRDSCIIEDLPAGSTAVFRVMSGGAGGWGLPSDITAVKTAESDASKACNSMLRDQANGSYFPPGSIVAIIFGVLAVLCLVGAGLFIMKRRQPPAPPPPAYKNDGMPPAY